MTKLQRFVVPTYQGKGYSDPSGAIANHVLANRWVIPRDALSEFAKTYNPSRGRPRTKRKYIKRSPIGQAA